MPQLRVTVPLSLRHNPKRGRRKLLNVPVEGASIEVTENGAVVGEVYGCIGGGTEIVDKRTNRTWFISALDLWTAYDEAKARQKKHIGRRHA